MNMSDMKKQAFEMLPEKRRPHVEGCVKAAGALAFRYEADVTTARQAALLHDVTKGCSEEEQLKLCKQYDIIPTQIELREWKLLHAKTGAAVARDRFGAPPEVELAIRYHTTGRAGMTIQEKILYIADYIEETRDFPGVDKLRELAFSDIDKAITYGLSLTAAEIMHRGGLISTDTVEAYNHLILERDRI